MPTLKGLVIEKREAHVEVSPQEITKAYYGQTNALDALHMARNCYLHDINPAGRWKDSMIQGSELGWMEDYYHGSGDFFTPHKAQPTPEQLLIIAVFDKLLKELSK